MHIFFFFSPQLPQETSPPISCVRPTLAWLRASWWRPLLAACRAPHHNTPRRSPVRGRSGWWKTGRKTAGRDGNRAEESLWDIIWKLGKLQNIFVHFFLPENGLDWLLVWTLSRIFLLSFLQGGSSWVSQEKERVREMSGKPCSRAGKPKQDTDWRAESSEGHLLPQSRVAAAASALKTVHRLLQHIKTNKKKTSEQN